MEIFNLDYNALWEIICKWSRKAGRAATRPILLMWYVMRDKNTPRKDKWAIFISLAYLILPIDILDAKRLPIIGWLDEVVSLAVLVQKMAKYITPEIEERANDQLDKWFPEYTEYEMIEGWWYAETPEAEYLKKKAEDYQRYAAYYTRKGDADIAKDYNRRDNRTMNDYKTQMRYADNADDKAADYLKRAARLLQNNF